MYIYIYNYIDVYMYKRDPWPRALREALFSRGCQPGFRGPVARHPSPGSRIREPETYT